MRSPYSARLYVGSALEQQRPAGLTSEADLCVCIHCERGGPGSCTPPSYDDCGCTGCRFGLGCFEASPSETAAELGARVDARMETDRWQGINDETEATDE